MIPRNLLPSLAGEGYEGKRTGVFELPPHGVLVNVGLGGCLGAIWGLCALFGGSSNTPILSPS